MMVAAGTKLAALKLFDQIVATVVDDRTDRSDASGVDGAGAGEEAAKERK